MKLMTKEISKKAQAAFQTYSTTEFAEQEVIAKFFDPAGSWTWYLLNQDPQDTDFLWGIVDGFEVEIGSFYLSELETTRNAFGLGIERDLYFKPTNAKQLLDNLNARVMR